MRDDPVVALYADMLAILETAIGRFGQEHPDVLIELVTEIDAPPFQGQCERTIYEGGVWIEKGSVLKL